MKYGANFSLFAYNPEKKRQPSTAGLTERRFQSPAERSQIRTRNLMYSNQASLITLDCMSEINCKQSKCFRHLTFWNLGPHCSIYHIAVFCDLARTMQYQQKA